MSVAMSLKMSNIIKTVKDKKCGFRCWISHMILSRRCEIVFIKIYYYDSHFLKFLIIDNLIILNGTIYQFTLM